MRRKVAAHRQAPLPGAARRVYPHRMDPELIGHIRSRIDRCRRLASATTDARAAEVLKQIAEEGEADLARLIAEAAGSGAGKDDPEVPVITIV